MPNVHFTLFDMPLQLACDAGEEDRVLELIGRLTRRLQAFPQALSKPNHSTLLLVMVGVMMEEEIERLKLASKLASYTHTIHDTLAENGASPSAAPEADTAAALQSPDKAVAKAIHAIAEYVEALANKYETLYSDQ